MDDIVTSPTSPTSTITKVFATLGNEPNINEEIYNHTLPNFGNKVFHETENSQREINDDKLFNGSNNSILSKILIFGTIIIVLLVISFFIIRYIKKKRNSKSNSKDYPSYNITDNKKNANNTNQDYQQFLNLQRKLENN